MSLEIKHTGDINMRTLNMLVYGNPKVGKTTFLGTCPNPLILSAESGLLSLRDKNLPYIEVNNFKVMEDVAEALQLGKLGEYTTICLDSLTEIQKVCMDHILEVEGIEKPRIQDWGTLNMKMQNMIRFFRDSNVNLVCTALADLKEEEGGLAFQTVPLMQGQIAKTIAGYFDEVFYMYTLKQDGGDMKHEMLTHGHKKVIAGDRSGKLPQRMAPDFNVVHSTIFGGDDASGDGRKVVHGKETKRGNRQ